MMRRIYTFLLIAALLIGANACYILNPDGYVKVVKPKNRYRYYRPSKDKKKKRIHYVYKKKRTYGETAKANATKKEDDQLPDESESGTPISDEVSPIAPGRTAEQEQDSSFLSYR